jgi:hypothetical protein
MKVLEVLWVLGIEPVREPQVKPADPWTIERWHLDMVSPGWQRIDVSGRVSDLRNPYQPEPPPHKCIVEVLIEGQAVASLDRSGADARIVLDFAYPPKVSVEIRQD